MSGLGLLSTAGIALKSKRDYEQEVSRFDDEKALNAERIKSVQQSNAVGADAATELARKRAAEAEERSTAQDYARASSPGYKFPDSQTAPAAPQPQAPVQVPVQAAADAEQPDDSAAAGASAAPAVAPAPSQRDVRVADTGAAAPTEQPMPASALPGSTFSTSTVKAPPAITPGGASSMTAPPRMASPAPAASAAPVAQLGGGRAGLLDVLAQKALARGDRTRYDELLSQKQNLEKEGMRDVAHEALVDPTNVRKIEEVFNSNGVRKLVPGSLIYQGKGMYSGATLNPDGTTRPFKDFDMLHAAMSMGVIAPPRIIAHKVDENVYAQGPDGKLTAVQEGQKFVTTTTRQGDAITTNAATGEVRVTKADGSEGRMSPQQSAGIREIMTHVGRVGKERSDQIPGQADNKPKIDQPQVAGTAQNIFLNNPELASKGLNAHKATEIAVAINDKDPSAVTGTAMRNGEMWNVVRYGKGKDALVYGVARSAQQPLPQAPKPAAPVAAPPPVVASVARPAPATLPQPPAPAAAVAPVERLGRQVDQFKAAVSEAQGRLNSIGARTLKADPEAANRIRAEIAQLERARNSAQAEYERMAGSPDAVRGRVLK